MSAQAAVLPSDSWRGCSSALARAAPLWRALADRAGASPSPRADPDGRQEPARRLPADGARRLRLLGPDRGRAEQEHALHLLARRRRAVLPRQRDQHRRRGPDRASAGSPRPAVGAGGRHCRRWRAARGCAGGGRCWRRGLGGSRGGDPRCARRARGAGHAADELRRVAAGRRACCTGASARSARAFRSRRCSSRRRGCPSWCPAPTCTSASCSRAAAVAGRTSCSGARRSASAGASSAPARRRRATPASRASRSVLGADGRWPARWPGIAGAIEVLGVHYRLIEGFSQASASTPSRSRCWRAQAAVGAAGRAVLRLPRDRRAGDAAPDRRAVVAGARDPGPDDGVRAVRRRRAGARRV